MAATIAFYRWIATQYATSAATGVAVSSASCLAFGGGSRGTWGTNISLGSWSSSLHHVQSTAESTVDVCQASHMHVISPVGNVGAWSDTPGTTRSTAALVNGSYVKTGVNGAVHTSQGIGIKFTNDTGVRVNPIYVYGCSGATFDSNPVGAYVAIMDLTSSQPTWSTANALPGSKRPFKVHGTSATEHWWSMGIAMYPHVVGHCGESSVRCEITFY
jgi:hypothetical protein